MSKTGRRATVPALLLALLALCPGAARSEDMEKLPPVRVAGVETLSTNGSTRGTAYCMSNKILTREGRTHVGWLDHLATVRVQTFDRATGKWLPAVTLGEGIDNHCGPSLAFDSQGYLHAIFGAHNDHFQYRRSLRPNDAAEWGPVEHVGSGVTYPSLVVDAQDALHLTCRGGKVPKRLMYYRKPAGGAWSEGRELVTPDVPDQYTQYGNSLVLDARGRIHLSFHVYDMHPAAGKTVGYLRSSDGGETWTRADGTPVALPATPRSVDVIEAGPELDMRAGNVDRDAEGNPWFGIVHHKSRERASDVWHHDGARWVRHPLLPALQSVYPGWGSTDAPVLAFGGDGRLYVALTAGAPGRKWGDPTCETVLAVSDDGGKSFRAMRLSEPDAANANWLASIERPTGHNRVGVPWILVTHGLVGQGTKTTNVTEILLFQLAGQAP